MDDNVALVLLGIAAAVVGFSALNDRLFGCVAYFLNFRVFFLAFENEL